MYMCYRMRHRGHLTINIICQTVRVAKSAVRQRFFSPEIRALCKSKPTSQPNMYKPTSTYARFLPSVSRTYKSYCWNQLKTQRSASLSLVSSPKPNTHILSQYTVSDLDGAMERPLKFVTRSYRRDLEANHSVGNPCKVQEERENTH
jgi:hypothetical protein